MKLLDTVALLEDMPMLNLYRGQVGTIVEEYEPGIFEVKFSDLEGSPYPYRDAKCITTHTLAISMLCERKLLNLS